jgi:hypothetical protein
VAAMAAAPGAAPGVARAAVPVALVVLEGVVARAWVVAAPTNVGRDAVAGTSRSSSPPN